MKRGIRDIRSFFKSKQNDQKDIDLSETNNVPATTSESPTSTTLMCDKTEKFVQDKNLLVEMDLQSTSSTRTMEVNIPNTLGSLDNGPHQPRLEKFPQTKFDKLTSFSVTFYSKYFWLEYSEEQDKVFCFVCRIFGSRCNIREQNETFCKTGFCKWKKLSESLNKHEKSVYHSDCAKMYIEYKKTKSDSHPGNDAEQLISFHELQLSKNREYMKKLIDIILVLLRQGLPLRGHREDVFSKNRGNLLEVAELFSVYDTTFLSYFSKNISYCSPKVQNEIIEIIAQLSLQKIVSEIKSCGFFTLMADETRSFKEEQLSIVVRFSKDLEVEKRFLSFINCSNSRDAQSLANIIFDFLEKSSLGDIPIVGQSYDGASVMSGKHKGLQALIKEKHPSVIYTHCLAHKLNLVVVDACTKVSLGASFFNTLEALYVHFSQPGNHENLKKVANNLGINLLEISSLSTTRWACRFKNCKAVLKNYEVIKTTLESEIRENQDRHAVEAVGLLECIQKTDFCICLHILTHVLLIVNVLSQYFQGKDATIGKASSIIEGTLKTLEDSRNNFDNIYGQIQNFAENHGISLEPIRASKRKKQIPAKNMDYIVESTLGHEGNIEIPSGPNSNHSEHWKINIYYQIMDNLISNFRCRFSNLPLAQAADALPCQIQNFAENHGISLEPIRASKRKKQIPAKNMDYIVESTLGHEGNIEIPSGPNSNHSEHWKINIYYQIMDNLISNFRCRFSNLPLAQAADALFQLNFNESQAFIKHYSSIACVNVSILEAEILVVKNMLTLKNLETN
ncbi:unnamed protein product [Brassicogethes aeneus]|uniref:TTF-type domain-containing protein n=1 Tax=Brassicogethes aeneus TaxID=1431903 RepID=A0A9P0BJB8_BRAAE|nr:unnamed protein product [Brassicogethes aeneus]